jgi:uncharacterized membrane protein
MISLFILHSMKRSKNYGLGNWALFVSLEKGAKAAVAIPLTVLYPLLTVVLATVFLSERLTLQEWLGIALALAGGAMLSYETSVGRGSAQGKQR